MGFKEVYMKYALITGATSGIGASYARLLAKNNYNLIITGRREEVIKSVAKEIRDKYGVFVKVVIVDFTISKDIQKLLLEINPFNIEFLVNNVGFGHKKVFLEDEYSIQKSMIDVHIDAMCRITHVIANKMKARGRGAIVNVSSMAAYSPAAFNHLYSASKVFINNFSESLYLDLIEYNVNVQALCPGFTKTDFHRGLDIDSKTFKDRGLIRWMTPAKVAKESYDLVLKRGGLYIPGISNKLLYIISKLLPKRIYYLIARRMSM